MKRTYVAVGIILLFLGACLIPAALSGQTNEKAIITVDDEPGDADFTTIKEAVNASHPGDTIEVYSGLYYDGDILINKENISLLGIPYELGGGNDTGKPYIKPMSGNGTKTADIIQVVASHVTVSNLFIQNLGFDISDYYSCVRIGDEHEDNSIVGCTISECTISRAIAGVLCSHGGHLSQTTIINNRIFDAQSFGILVEPDNYTDVEGDYAITGNTIIDCSTGIYFMADQQNISGNSFKICDCGLILHGKTNSIVGNDFDNCSVPLRDFNSAANDNSITKNNFKAYSRGFLWWGKPLSSIISMMNIFRKKEWSENYYDTWGGVGPKAIPGGFLVNGKIACFWWTFDWRPAREPYDIGR